MGADSERCVIGKTLDATRSPKVCKIMAFVADIMGLGLLFYLLLGSRQLLHGAIGPFPIMDSSTKCCSLPLLSFSRQLMVA